MVLLNADVAKSIEIIVVSCPPRTAMFEVGLVISLLSLGSEEGVLGGAGRHSSTLRFSIGSLEIIESLAVNLAMTESWKAG